MHLLSSKHIKKICFYIICFHLRCQAKRDDCTKPESFTQSSLAIYTASIECSLRGETVRRVLCIEIVHVQTGDTLMCQTLDLGQQFAHSDRPVELAP